MNDGSAGCGGSADPARNWNPIDHFWRLFYPMFNPRPDRSPVRLGCCCSDPPAPIWDLPSPHNRHNTGVLHPEERNAVPHFVAPDYFYKLQTPPPHAVICQDPPSWMVMANLSTADWCIQVPAFALSGPLFIAAYNRIAGLPRPTLWCHVTAVSVGTALGLCRSYVQAENRLQGYAPNTSDCLYWRQRVEQERRIRAGEIDDRFTGSMSEQALKQLLGPKVVNLKELEKTYYGSGKEQA